MGLDTSHDCWHGAYSTFHRWRAKLAEVAGLPPLEWMEGFAIPGRPSTGYALSLVVAANALERHGMPDNAASLRRWAAVPGIKWSLLKPSPLHILLQHSDCDGEIAASDCGPIADALEELLPLLPGDDDSSHIGNWRTKTRQFIEGLRAASAAGEAVEFH